MAEPYGPYIIVLFLSGCYKSFQSLLLYYLCFHTNSYFFLQETDAIYKANNLTQTISGILSKDCLCQFSYKHIGEQHFSCSESSRDIVIFEGRIIGTAERHSSDILQMLQKWVNEGAKISLSGIQLQVINDCSVSQDSYGSDTCNFVNNSTQVIEPIPCNSAATTVLAVLFATTLVLLIFTCAMLWTCFCHYRRSNKE